MPFAVCLDLNAAADHYLGELAACVLADAVDVVETVHDLGDSHHISLAIYDELPTTLRSPPCAGCPPGADLVQAAAPWRPSGGSI